jgi:hypothetical protein
MTAHFERRRSGIKIEPTIHLPAKVFDLPHPFSASTYTTADRVQGSIYPRQPLNLGE